MIKFLILLAGVLVGFTACGGDDFLTPRPRAYPKVDYPTVKYQQLEMAACPFSFAYPDYMEIKEESSFFDEAPPHPCWFNLHMPQFNADIHLTYSPVSNSNQLQMLVQDAYLIANEQHRRASYIEDYHLSLPGNIYGIAFNLEGPSASPFQFFVTDSIQHFLRGSLYFNTRPNPDSLAPIADFIKSDMLRIVESIQWED